MLASAQMLTSGQMLASSLMVGPRSDGRLGPDARFIPYGLPSPDGLFRSDARLSPEVGLRSDARHEKINCASTKTFA